MTKTQEYNKNIFIHKHIKIFENNVPWYMCK